MKFYTVIQKTKLGQVVFHSTWDDYYIAKEEARKRSVEIQMMLMLNEGSTKERLLAQAIRYVEVWEMTMNSTSIGNVIGSRFYPKEIR